MSRARKLDEEERELRERQEQEREAIKRKQLELEVSTVDFSSKCKSKLTNQIHHTQ